MTAERTPQAPGDGLTAFVAAFAASLTEGSFVRLTLGCWRGTGSDIVKVTARIVEIKGSEAVHFVAHHRTRDLARNVPFAQAPATAHDYLEKGFRAARLFTTSGDIQADWKKSAGFRLTRSGPTLASLQSPPSHDRVKRRLIPASAPFLRELGVTNANARVLPSMSHKWKQINRFIEILDGAVAGCDRIGVRQDLSLVDFGAGKGYLTFAAHHHLRVTLGRNATVTGIERRADLVRFCNGVVSKLGLSGLEFRVGDLRSQSVSRADIMMALHACDTATDEAIAMGIRAGAAVIVCAPCCHKEIRPQLAPPAVLRPLLRFGVHAAQEAEMLTDAMRALLMEARGYAAQVFEFISTEHTDKNKMIVGILRSGAGRSERALDELAALKQFYGISAHRLETLLRTGCLDASEEGRSSGE